MSDHVVFGLFTAGRCSSDFLFEGKVLTSENRCHLGRLHPVVFRHGLRKRLQEPFFLDA